MASLHCSGEQAQRQFCANAKLAKRGTLFESPVFLMGEAISEIVMQNQADTSNRREYMKEYRKRHKRTHRTRKVTLTVSEDKRFDELAKQHDRTVPEQIKQMALAYARQEVLRPTAAIQREEDQIAQVIRTLRGIGNNVNQIARDKNIERKSLWGNSPNIPKLLEGIFAKLEQVEKLAIRLLQQGPS